MVWRFNPNTQIGLIQRFYAKNYISPHAQAFAENGRVQNESGLCLRFDAGRLGPFGVHTLLDYFYHPWPRYTMTRFSQGCEATAMITYQPRQNRKWLLRYSFKNNERSDVRHHSHRLRLTYSQQVGTRWTLSASALGNRHIEPWSRKASNGFAILPKVGYISSNQRWRCAMQLVWFDTQDYNSRLYAYEPCLDQSFNWNMMAGRGERLAATVRWHSSSSEPSSLSSRTLHRPQWRLQVKVGITHYRDRDAISSGPTLIQSPLKADLNILCNCRF